MLIIGERRWGGVEELYYLFNFSVKLLLKSLLKIDYRGKNSMDSMTLYEKYLSKYLMVKIKRFI